MRLVACVTVLGLATVSCSSGPGRASSTADEEPGPSGAGGAGQAGAGQVGAGSGQGGSSIGVGPGGSPMNGSSTDAAVTSGGAGGGPGDKDASASGSDRSIVPTGGSDGPVVTAGADGGVSMRNDRNYSTDKALFFGESRCAQANVLFCEDFESGTLNTAVWRATGGPTIDGVQKARGGKALHIVKNGNGGAFVRETKSFPVPNNTYYGRAFIWFESLPGPPMTYAHWTFIGAAGTGVASEVRISGQLQGGVNRFGIGTDNRTATGTGDWTSTDRDPAGKGSPVPVKEWLCIEWMHKGDSNETRFWWDGVEHPSLSTSPTKHGGNKNPFLLPTFTSLWLGWTEYQPSTLKFEMWIDEIALDKDRIGCVL